MVVVVGWDVLGGVRGRRSGQDRPGAGRWRRIRAMICSSKGAIAGGSRWSAAGPALGRALRARRPSAFLRLVLRIEAAEDRAALRIAEVDPAQIPGGVAHAELLKCP